LPVPWTLPVRPSSTVKWYIHDGRTNFSELQADLAAGKQDRLVYYAFDLLWRDGDLRGLPHVERKQALSDLLGENGIEHSIIYSEHDRRRAGNVRTRRQAKL
jgi:ATP-dependent DNA ligase